MVQEDDVIKIDNLNEMIGISQDHLDLLGQHQTRLLKCEPVFYEKIFAGLANTGLQYEQGSTALFLPNFFTTLVSTKFDQSLYHELYMQVLHWKQLGLKQNQITLLINQCRHAVYSCLDEVQPHELLYIIGLMVDALSLLNNHVFHLVEVKSRITQKFAMDVNHIKRSYELVSAAFPAELMQVYEDHVKWKILAFSMALGEMSEEKLPLSTQECRLGKWLNAGGWHKIPQTALQSFDQAHHDVHELAVQAIECNRNSQPDQIVRILNSMEEASNRVTEVLMQVMETELIRFCTLDSLTGLPNRKLFDDILEKQLAFAKRRNLFVGLVLIDIDYFKPVNDNYGHLKGDQVLEQLADILSVCMREEESVFRWGGEEFLALTLSEKADDCFVLAERMRDTIAKTSFGVVEDGELKITVSCGAISTKSFSMLQFEEVFGQLDDLLYKAKKAGRNRTFHKVLEAE